MPQTPSHHHKRLPESSTLLSGRNPPNDVGFRSDQLQIWYNNSTESWTDPVPHAHLESDEIFVVLWGTMVVDVDGKHITVGPGEFCAFPMGSLHSIVEVHPPIESLMIRAPSIDDKVGADGARL